MIVVLQRVSKAEIKIKNNLIGKINKGLVVLLGINKGDKKQDADFLIKKILTLRIFNDSDGKMNLSVKEVTGSILLVSQFTLCADTAKGRRPSFLNAEGHQRSKRLYEYFLIMLRKKGILVEAGHFGADMDIELINNGPVTIIINSIDS
tara:strand:+ start:79 stop:525 length:447 start_codon:yes stop_codon:yes gene_type:complete